MRTASAALLVVTLAVLAGAGYFFAVYRRPAAPVPIVKPPAAVAVAESSAPSGTIPDPLNADRAAAVDSARVPPPDWVTARPSFQYSRTAVQRGGVEPCAIPAADKSAFQEWTPVGQGHFTAPRSGALDGAGRFDLVIHTHGDDPVLRELVQSGQRFVLYTLTFAPGKSYGPSFTTQGFQALVTGIEEALSKREGKPAHAGRVALSAWSAGFSGVEQALTQPVAKDVDAVILIDGLHAPRGDALAFKAQLKPFVDYAARAAAGERFMFISHSSIDPPTFCSTTECAHYLIASLDGKPQLVHRDDAEGLELVEMFDRGGLHVRGYAGNDKADHCAQLALLKDAFKALGQRWAASAPK
jgi:hypothetical protein